MTVPGELADSADPLRWAERFVHEAMMYPQVALDMQAMRLWFAAAISAGELAGTQGEHAACKELLRRVKRRQNLVGLVLGVHILVLAAVLTVLVLRMARTGF